MYLTFKYIYSALFRNVPTFHKTTPLDIDFIPRYILYWNSRRVEVPHPLTYFFIPITLRATNTSQISFISR